MEAGDADLLRSVAEGDEVALRTLVERHAGWLKLRLCRRTGDEDLVADANVRRLYLGESFSL